MPPGQGDQCPFCQLIANPGQLMIVGETDNFYAWLEFPQPRAKGQANVVPKEHVESVLEFSPEEYHEAMTLVRETVEKAVEGLGADGVSITMNVKEVSGQMLPHAYIQIFPRFEDDENAGTPTGAIFQHREELQDEDIIREIKDDMNSVSPDFGVETIEPHPESQRFKEDEEGSKDRDQENEDKTDAEEDDSAEKKPKRGRSIEWS